MSDIKNYLEKQIKLSKELNDILKNLNNIENSERKFLYEENEKLLSELNCINNENVSSTSDRITELKQRVKTLLEKDETNKDIKFKKYLTNLNNELVLLSLKVNNLNENLCEMNEKHNEWLATRKQNFEKIEKIDIVSDIETNNKSDLKVIEAEKECLKAEKKCIKAKEECIEVKKDYVNTKNNFEFKLGSNMLNVLGVILILISIITFGKYIYVNHMTDTMKGIFLYIISLVIFILGEKNFYKKVPKFGVGLSALGIGSLYASTIINYLVLNTINSMIAIIIVLIITMISLFVSSKHNLNTVRIIALIGGYGCLIPMNELGATESLVTMIMMLIISIANIYMPVNKNSFSIYSSILNIIFCTIISFYGYLETPIIILYLITTLALNNFMYIRLCKENYQGMYRFWSFVTGMYLIMSSEAFLEYIFFSLGLGYILIAAICYCLSDKKIKSSFYNQGLYVAWVLISKYLNVLYEFEILNVLCFAALVGLTVYVSSKTKDAYMKISSFILIVTTLINFIESDSITSFLIYFILLVAIIWISSKKHKNQASTIVLKHSFLIALLSVVGSKEILSTEYNLYIQCVIAILYVLILTHIERLRHDAYKRSNKFVLIITFLIVNIPLSFELLSIIITLLLGGLMLILLTDSNYVKSNFINKYSMLIYSLYSTYGICLLIPNINMPSNIDNIVLSIVLILFAFINVWIGFKHNLVEVRKYGLVLSLLVCAKLILIDFYSYDFIVKAILFLVIGIIVLTISYIYAKLEEEIRKQIK